MCDKKDTHVCPIFYTYVSKQLIWHTCALLGDIYVLNDVKHVFFLDAYVLDVYNYVLDVYTYVFFYDNN